MEQEIHNLLVELFKRYAKKRNYYLKSCFHGDAYSISDIEQDFYIKLFNDLIKDQSKIDKIQDESYFNRSLQNFIIDYFRKNSNKNRILSFRENELFDNVIYKHVILEEEISNKLTINLSQLIQNFNEIEIELIRQHYFYNVEFVVLNQVFNHSNTQQKTARLIERLRKEFKQIQNENPDFDIVIINDLT
jgi:hypothetical protein